MKSLWSTPLFCILLCLIGFQPPGFAQNIPDAQNQLIQDILESLEVEGELDYNTIYERLELWLTKPFDINQDPLSELVEQFLITDIQKIAIESHLIRHGPLISVYELQSIDALDLNTIRNLVPFIATRGSIKDFNVPVGKMLTSGKNEFFTRWSQVLEQQKGFSPAPDSLTSRYQGDANRLYIRFRHTYENRLSYGFTAEKDAGEPFFRTPNEYGFDFYSGHLYVKNYRNWLKDVAIGDYTLSMGQGLIYYGGFALGKSSFVTQIKRSSPTIRPFRSVNESDFLRGAAATFQFSQNLDLSIFASQRKRDGSITTDTIEFDDSRFTVSRGFTSLIASGLHRTQSEIANKNTIQNTTYGGRINYHRNALNVSLNVVQNELSDPFQRFDGLYNKYRFSGKSLTNASIDYSYIWRNVHFFGETGWSDNGSVASVNGVLLGLDRNVNAAILVRAFPRDFHTLVSNVFSETGQSDNEVGVYFGLEVQPSQKWTISGYYDTWKHPWLKFNIDAPSRGNEQLLKVEYYLKRKFDIYAQLRREVKQRNQPLNETTVDFLAWQQKYQFRIQVSSRASKSLELRNRFEVSRFRFDNQSFKKGFLIYQDIIYRPLGFPLSFTGRIALFDTDGYDARIYAYENDVIYSFFIPAYFDRGVRYYLNLRYKGIRNLTAEIRYARTEVTNRNTLSSGLNQINNNHRSEIKAQIIYRW